MSDEEDSNNDESIAEKLERKLGDAYGDGSSSSYEMKVRDGSYWKKVKRYSELKDIIEGNM